MTAGRTLNRIAALDLLVGAAFGMAGTLVASPSVQASLWAIDSVGLVFAIGEGVLLSGTAAGPSASVPAFAAGTALWSAGWPSSVPRGSSGLGCGCWGQSRPACSP